MDNKARITKKIIIPVFFKTEAPLRVASGNDDNITDILILKNKNGVPFIPGTSLAGVLRNTMEGIIGEVGINQVFGNTDKSDTQSLLTVSDMEFNEPTIKILHRDGIKLNSFTGTVTAGAKFDYESIDRNAEGRFILELTVRVANEIANPDLNFVDVADKLASVLQQGISVGSLTTKGYGLVKSKAPVKYYVFDFANDATAINQWLAYAAQEDIYNLPEALAVTCKGAESVEPYLIEISADFALRSTLIVRGQDDIKEAGVAAQLRSGEDAVIPGSSIKGSLNNRALRILTELAGGNAAKAKEFYESFAGTTEQKSRLLVQEAYLSAKEIDSSLIVRTRIDRFTGGAYGTGLHREKPIYQKDAAKAPVHISLRVRKSGAVDSADLREKAAIGLLLLLLKDMWLGSLTIGGGRGVGRGSLEGRRAEIRIGDSIYKLSGPGGKLTSGSEQELEQYLVSLEEVLQ